MVKRWSVCLAALFGVFFICSSAFAFGGSPAPSDAEQQVQSQQDTAREEALNKARTEMQAEKRELVKVEKYLWNLQIRMDDAKRSGNSKKLLELKELEQETVERARLLKGSIERKKELYPELKVSEALESAKVENSNTNENVIVVNQEEKIVTTKPVIVSATPKQPVVPIEQTMAPVPSGRIIYHEVELGDTLMSISRKYYGNASMYKDIAKLNNIPVGQGLRQGQLLKIDMNLKRSAPKPVVNPPL
jgi:nucleoid-associated protein YgaU